VTNPRDFIKKLNTTQTLLGLDFGDKTIGLASSDKTRTIATPLKTIKRKSINKDLIELQKIIVEYDVGGLVLGLPLNLNGEENLRTEKMRKFARIIEKMLQIEITFYDERYSSDVIFKELRRNSISASKIKKKINHMAAAYILQGFLDNAVNS